MEQIACAVGIKAPSLYKHFPSKQGIFDALFERTEHDFNEFLSELSVHIGNAGGDTDSFGSMPEDMIAQKMRSMMIYLLHDEHISRFRKMMTIEQFRSAELAVLYSERYVGKLIDYHAEIFAEFAARGIFDCDDPQAAAYMYCSPIIVLLGICDRQPEREAECLDILERSVRLFMKRFGRSPDKEDKNEEIG